MKNSYKILILMMIAIGILNIFVNAASIEDESFTLLQTTAGVTCSDDGRFWLLQGGGRKPTIAATNNIIDILSANCFDVRGINTRVCCPNGYSCINNNAGIDSEGRPILSCVPNEKTHCSDLKTRSECEGNLSKAAANRTIYDINQRICGYQSNSYFRNDTHDEIRMCYITTECSCVFNSTGNNCNAYEDKKIICNSKYKDAPIRNDSIGSCEWVLDTWVDECANGGSITATYKGNPIGENIPEDCTIKTITVECGQNMAFGFFDSKTFIISTLLIIAIYIILNIKRGENET